MSQTNLSLSWNAFKNNVCDGLSSFQQNEEFVDMTLAADGHLVKVHKMVISLASPYLKQLIISAPCPHPVLFLNHVSYQSLCSILEYIYSGEVLLKKDDIGQFIQAAKALHIKGLDIVDLTETSESVKEHQASLNTDSNLITEKMPKRMKTDNIQTWQQLHKERQEVCKIDHTSNQTSLPNIDTSTSNMNESMEDDFQGSLEVESDSHIGMKVERQKSCTSKIKSVTDLNKKPSVQYTLSNQGNIQMILNRYLYNIRYVYKNANPPTRLWRCVEYTKKRCPASVTTQDDVVVQRTGVHQHTFHDKRILKKVSSGWIVTEIKDAENKVKTLKHDKSDESADTYLSHKDNTETVVLSKGSNDPLGE